MVVLKTKWFSRFSRRMKIEDEALCEAVSRAEVGLVDADLGGIVIKQRVGRPRQGRSGGYRVLIGYRRNHRAIFIFGFAKNELGNVDDDELVTLRELAAEWLNMDSRSLGQAISDGRAEEVHCGKES